MSADRALVIAAIGVALLIAADRALVSAVSIVLVGVIRDISADRALMSIEIMCLSRRCLAAEVREPVAGCIIATTAQRIAAVLADAVIVEIMRRVLHLHAILELVVTGTAICDPLEVRCAGHIDILIAAYRADTIAVVVVRVLALVDNLTIVDMPMVGIIPVVCRCANIARLRCLVATDLADAAAQRVIRLVNNLAIDSVIMVG